MGLTAPILLSLSLAALSCSLAATRVFYLSADEVTWNYAPNDGKNQCFQEDTPARSILGDSRPDTLYAMVLQGMGGDWKKAKFREYTDDSFSTMKTDNSPEFLGTMGPILRAEAGDMMQVVLHNNLPFAINFSPSGGAEWSSENDKTLSAGSSPVTKPGETRSYMWKIPEDAAPMNPNSEMGEQNSRMYVYRSTLDVFAHDNAGLVGPIIVTSKGHANADGSTKGVDRDFVSLFQVLLEKKSPFWEENKALAESLGKDEWDAQNGFMYCNNDHFKADKGEKVRWHVASMGSEASMHNFHWHGNPLIADGRRVDQINVIGGNTATLDISTDNPGVWMFHCHVNEHFVNGMVGKYEIRGEREENWAEPDEGGDYLEYYIAADLVEWDYADGHDVNGCNNETLTNKAEGASTWLGGPEPSIGRIGSKYWKALYREYEDETFTTLKSRSSDDAYLGMIGPLLKARVGDQIKLVFKNNLPVNATANGTTLDMPPISVHVHGMMYNKSGEGAPYSDGTDANDDDFVFPQTTFTYIWKVTNDSAPGAKDANSKLWMYHSHTDEVADGYAGLIGGILVYPRDHQPNVDTADLVAGDIDREITTFFEVVDESGSFLADYNVAYHLPSMSLEDWKENKYFPESSLKHALNGWMFCNSPKLSLDINKKYRFHVMALGTLADIHTPNFVGGVLDSSLQGHTDSVAILAGSMMSLDLMFTESGTFPLACRVADHVVAGTIINIEVNGSPDFDTAVAPDSAVREYWIRAEEVDWDWAPEGYAEDCYAEDLSEDAKLWIENSDFTIGSKRKKYRFVQYTANYESKVDQPTYMGILGPIITAEVGDTVMVHLENNLPEEINFAMGGGFIEKNQGSTDSVNRKLQNGERADYEWVVPENAGPDEDYGNDELNSVPYTYASTVAWGRHQTAGLIGLVHVVKKGDLQSDGMKPVGVDMVVPFVLQVMDENGLNVNEAGIPNLLEESLDMAGNLNDGETIGDFEARVADANKTADWKESNVMHGINALMYCNWKVNVPNDGKVRLLMAGFGSEEGIHSPRIIGQQLKVMGQPKQSQTLMPAVARAGDIVAHGEGRWTALCDIHDHVFAGMIGVFGVGSAPKTGMLTVAMNVSDAANATAMRNDFEGGTATSRRSLLTISVQEMVERVKNAVQNAAPGATGSSASARTLDNTFYVDVILMFGKDTTQSDIDSALETAENDEEAQEAIRSAVEELDYEVTGATFGGGTILQEDDGGDGVDDGAAATKASGLVAAFFLALVSLVLA